MEIKRPKVGVGVEILKGNQVLLGKRKGTGFADSFYSSPGGHLEWGESFEECAKREIFEETGLEVTNIRFICLTNTTDPTHDHYVDIGMAAGWVSGEPELKEPHKCEGWAWYDIDNLPEPLIPGDKVYLEALKTGKVYFGTMKGY